MPIKSLYLYFLTIKIKNKKYSNKKRLIKKAVFFVFIIISYDYSFNVVKIQNSGYFEGYLYSN